MVKETQSRDGKTGKPNSDRECAGRHLQRNPHVEDKGNHHTYKQKAIEAKANRIIKDTDAGHGDSQLGRKLLKAARKYG